MLRLQLVPTTLGERWILSRLAAAIATSGKGFIDYEYATVTTAIYNFWLYELCDVYLVRRDACRRRDAVPCTPLTLFWRGCGWARRSTTTRKSSSPSRRVPMRPASAKHATFCTWSTRRSACAPMRRQRPRTMLTRLRRWCCGMEMA